MGMKKKALRAAGYAMAPKLSLLMKSPKTAAWMKAGAMAGSQAMERMVPERFQPRPRRTPLGMAARGLGAAAVAAPLGWWLGRKILGREEMSHPAR